MDNIVYVIRDIDMNYTVDVCRTMGKVMENIMETMKEGSYTSFTFVDTDSAVYFVTFPHGDSQCVGHWRIEKWEMED